MRAVRLRGVAAALCGIAFLLGIGYVGPLAAAPATLIWWLGTRWMTHGTATITFVVAAWLHLTAAATGFHSNDLYRYLWEGGVQLEGFSPYVMAPADGALESLRDERFPRIAHPELPTVYPPLAQATFVTAAAWGAREIDYRNGILFLNLATVGLLLLWLRATGRGVGRAAFYAWSPVAVLSACGGHVDVVMLAALVGFAWSWEVGAYRRAGCCLAAAILAKTVAVLLLPWAVWRRPREVLALVPPIVVLAYLPYVFAGDVSGSLVTFAREFRFNSPVYAGLVTLLGDAAPLAAAAALLLGISWIALRIEGVADAAALTLVALLVVSPVVHYWYLTWFLVLLPAVRSEVLRSGGLAWAASIVALTPLYLAIARGGEPPAAGPRLLAEALLPVSTVCLAIWRVGVGSRGDPRRDPTGARLRAA